MLLLFVLPLVLTGVSLSVIGAHSTNITNQSVRMKKEIDSMSYSCSTGLCPEGISFEKVNDNIINSTQYSKGV